MVDLDQHRGGARADLGYQHSGGWKSDLNVVGGVVGVGHAGHEGVGLGKVEPKLASAWTMRDTQLPLTVRTPLRSWERMRACCSMARFDYEASVGCSTGSSIEGRTHQVPGEVHFEGGRRWGRGSDVDGRGT